MGKIGDLFVRLGLKMDDFKKGVQDATRQTEQMTAKTESLGGRMKDTWQGVAMKIAAIGVAVRSIGKAYKTIADFEQANANLATILGKSVAEIKDMTDSALQLGRTTQFTASQVTQLQTELAKLGFSTDAIKDMQKPVLDFSTAVGTDLASAAAFAGATLRAFGLSSTDTEEVLDTLATATNKSALSFSSLQTAMSIVAPVANTFGFSLKDTTALLGTLANAGFDASSAATATRNIILNLANSNGKLAKSLGHSVTNLDELLDGLAELNDKGVDLNTTLELTDKRSVAAFNTFIAGAEATRELRKELEEVGGAAATIANDRLQTVSGSVQILKSAWEGFVLSLSNSKGVVKQAIDQLTELVTALTGVFNKDVRMSNKAAPYEAMLRQMNGLGKEGAIAELRKLKSKRGYKRDADAIELAIQNVYGNESHPVFTSSSAPAPATTTASGGDTSDLLSKLFGGTGKKFNRKKALELIGYDITNDLVKEIEKQAEEMPPALELPEIKLKDINTKQLDTYLDNLKAFEQECEGVAEEFKAAVVGGFSQGMQTMMDGLMGLQEINAGMVLQSLLEPLADLAIRQGEIIMASGIAMSALGKSLTNLKYSPYAIAAGAALVAVGSAAKAGLAGLANSMGGGNSASSATTAQSATSSSVYSEEIVVKVEGKISGSDILISGSRTQKNWNR